MKIIGKRLHVVSVIAIVSLIAIPTVSTGDRYQVLRELELVPGTYEETIPVGESVREAVSSRLKGVSLAVRNGTEKDRHRVASAQVFLNGEEIFDQNDFNHKYTSLSEFREFPEGLSQMDIRVKVSGSKHSRLMITLTGVYEDDPVISTPVTWYLDRDGDGVGSNVFEISLNPPPPPPPPGSWVLVTGDINDNDPYIH